MASPSPLRRSSRHQNNERMSEDTNTLNILAKHEENDVSKSSVYNNKADNNSISLIKSENASPMINGGRLSQLDNGRVLQSNANANSETKPISVAPPGNALSNIGRLLRSAAKSGTCIKLVNDTPARVLKSYPEIEPDIDSPQSNHSFHKGGIIQPKTNTISEIESASPSKFSLGSGRFLRSKVNSNPVSKPVHPVSKPVHDTPPGKHSLDSGSVLRSKAKSIPEIEHVNDTPPGKHSLDSRRVLRSRTNSNSETKHVNDTPPGNSVMKEYNPEIESLNNTPPVRGRKKSKEKVPNNQYSAIFDRVRYLLTKMKYEQNLINAYSDEGWKGQSTEKVRPKKEIGRAKSDILKLKLEVRALFQHLDSALSEGQIDDTLFDSEGQIDSEDIYCAKCHSKDVSTDNDIILCDGMCVRAFHQKCLNPPLLSENIPVGDDGWLCPACECKIDCIKLLIEFQGSTMELTDTWENVFPEAAEFGNGDKDDGGLPSVDLEDDNFDPDCKDLDNGSDDNGVSKKSATSMPNFETVTKLGEEILAELDWDLEQENEKLLGKRKIEGLNYRKFCDETNGNSSSDSADDENWSETYDTSDDDWRAGARNKKKRYARSTNKSSTSLQRKIYETTKQKLYESFQENQYPTREEKESLAQELGLDYLQVSNWFNTTRHRTRQGIYASPSKLMMPDGISAETPTADEHPEKKNILPEALLMEGSMINQIDMGASPTSFPMPIIVNSYVNAGTASINEIDISASPNSFPMPNMMNSYASAGTSSINEIDMGASPSSFPMPEPINSYVGTGTTSINEQPIKRDVKAKLFLEIPLKEGTSLSQIDIKRQQAIARELKKMKHGR